MDAIGGNTGDATLEFPGSSRDAVKSGFVMV